VIGNSAYQHAAVLDNPKNDASDMAAAAEKLGFKVIKGLDLDKSGMDRTIRQFAEALKGASVGMFFYAGHGLQVSGRNYLVPIDAQLKTAEALDFEMVGLDVVQRTMENASETNVLFVDACRDNPLSRNLARAMGTRSVAIGRGLVDQEAGSGTLISYSTQPGNVALDSTESRNSPYAAALAKHITTQGKDLPSMLVLVRRDVMAATGNRQVPWEHSALTAELMLAPPADAPPKPKASEKTDGTKSDVKTATTTIPTTKIPNTEMGASSPAVAATEGEGGCAQENPAKTFIADFAKLKRAYDTNLIDPGEFLRRRKILVSLAVPEILRGRDSEDCVIQKLKHLSDLYKLNIVDPHEYIEFKAQLSKRYFQ
jgi:Caspase domain